MKKTVAVLLVLICCLGVFCACNEEEKVTVTVYYTNGGYGETDIKTEQIYTHTLNKGNVYTFSEFYDMRYGKDNYVNGGTYISGFYSDATCLHKYDSNRSINEDIDLFITSYFEIDKRITFVYDGKYYTSIIRDGNARLKKEMFAYLYGEGIDVSQLTFYESSYYTKEVSIESCSFNTLLTHTEGLYNTHKYIYVKSNE